MGNLFKGFLPADDDETNNNKKILHYLSTRHLITIGRLVSKDWKAFIDDHFKTRISFHRVRSIGNFFSHQHQHAIAEVNELAGGLTNKTYRVRTRSRERYVARQAGKHSNLFINRSAESTNLTIASELGVAPAVFHSSDSGSLISKFIDDAETMSPALLQNAEKLKQVVLAMRKIHQSGKRFANNCDVFKRNHTMLEILTTNKIPLPPDYSFITPIIDRIEKIISRQSIETVPCHNDTTPGNFILAKNKMWIIDWEYSGNNDPLWDLVNLSMEAGFTKKQDYHLLANYYDNQVPDDVKLRFMLYKPVVEYWVSLWSLVQIANKNYEKLETLQELEERRRNNCLHLLQANRLNEHLEKITIRR